MIYTNEGMKKLTNKYTNECSNEIMNKKWMIEDYEYTRMNDCGHNNRFYINIEGSTFWFVLTI